MNPGQTTSPAASTTRPAWASSSLPTEAILPPAKSYVGLVPKPARPVDHSPVPYQRVELHGSSVVCVELSNSRPLFSPLPLDVRKRRQRV